MNFQNIARIEKNLYVLIFKYWKNFYLYENYKNKSRLTIKKNDKHINHLFIHLNSNFESNIKTYGNFLLTDIEYFKINLF